MSRNIARRAVLLFLLWLVLIGADLAHVPAGLAVVAAATAVSFRLRPASTQRVRVIAMSALLLRLAGQAIVAGVDVARRALMPLPAVQPGFVSHRLRLPPGSARDAFCALASLLPGTVPAGLGARGELVIHCLDVDLPVADQMASDEARFLAALDEPLGG